MAAVQINLNKLHRLGHAHRANVMNENKARHALESDWMSEI